MKVLPRERAVGKARRHKLAPQARAREGPNQPSRSGGNWVGLVPPRTHPPCRTRVTLLLARGQPGGKDRGFSASCHCSGAGPARSSPPCRRVQGEAQTRGMGRAGRGVNAQPMPAHTARRLRPKAGVGAAAGHWGAWEMLGWDPTAPRVPSGLCLPQGAPRSGPLHSSHFLVAGSFSCIFLWFCSFIYAQQPASVPSGAGSSGALSGAQPGSARGLVTLDESLSCSGPLFPHLSKGRNGGAWSNKQAHHWSSSPSPKYSPPCLRSQAPCGGASVTPPLSLSGGSPAPLTALLSPQSLASALRLPSGGGQEQVDQAVAMPAGASGLVRGLVQDSGPASTVFGKDNSSAL